MVELKEKIIVIKESGKLPLTMAYHKANLFNTRFFNPVELAQEALIRSEKLCTKEFISKNEELFYLRRALEGNDYFSYKKFSDIKRISASISTLRKQVVNNENKEIKTKLEKGVFKEKNDAIYEIYCEYMALLNKENKIDTIGLIRYAIDNADKVFGECKILNEFPLDNIEAELLKRVCINTEVITVNELLHLENKDFHIQNYQNCYGTSNEVAWILDDIADRKYNPDECVIACADYSTYSQIFYDYSCKYKINISFGNGLSIINSYPGKFLEYYYAWMSSGNFDWYHFFKLIYSPYFNLSVLKELLKGVSEGKYKLKDLLEKVSKLRLTNNLDINTKRISELNESISNNNLKNIKEYAECLEDIKTISKELSLPIEEFIEKYAIERTSSDGAIMDRSAKRSICNEIILIKKTGMDITADAVEDILKKKTPGMQNKPGFLYVTSIDSAIVSLRKHLYICGLSASSYPGSPKENPLLLDSDLHEFGNEILTSQGKIKQKTKNLFSLIETAGSLSNDIQISYPGLNVSELKTNNASSLIFEIFKMEDRKNSNNKQLKDLEKAIHKTEYFDPALSITKGIGNEYNNSMEIEFKNQFSSTEQNVPIAERSYSPSALNTFFNCPKQFYFQNILKIPVLDDYAPYEIISATDRGTLAHSLMEYLSEHSSISQDEFVDVCKNTFNDYLKINVPFVMEDADKEREEFLEMMSNGWSFDNLNKRELITKEENIECIHKESGIKIHGYPDRVEKMSDGKAVIVDFKTESKIGNHKENDVATCLQVLIYAYIVESTGLKVDHCEYRMLRFEDGIINCKYDEEIKNQLTEMLCQFKKALDAKDFSIEPMPKKEEKDKCKYCKYGAICGKETSYEKSSN